MIFKSLFDLEAGVYWEGDHNALIVVTDVISHTWNNETQSQERLSDPDVIYRDLVFMVDKFINYKMPLTVFKSKFKKYPL